MGIEKESFIGKTVYDIVSREMADLFDAKDQELYQKGTVQEYQSRMRVKGEYRDVMFYKSIFRNPLGAVQGLIGTILDITEQTKAETVLQEQLYFEKIVSTLSAECLKATEDTIDTLLQKTLALIGQFIHAEQGYLFIASEECEKTEKIYQWSYEHSQAAIIPCSEAVYHGNRTVGSLCELARQFRRMQKQTAYFELQSDLTKQVLFPMKNGDEWTGFFYFEWSKEKSVQLTDAHTTLVKVLAEVFAGMVQRHRAEKSLRVSEQETKAILEAIPDLIVLTNPDCRILDFRQAQDFGYIKGREYYLGRTAGEVLPDKAAQAFQQHIPLAFREKRVVSFEYEMVYDGAAKYREARVIAISEQSALILIRDITEKKAAEEEIHKLSRAVDQSPGVVIMTDLAGKIHYVNSKFTQVTGYGPAESIGEELNILRSGEHSDEFYAAMWNTLYEEKEWCGEICNRKKDGELYWALTSISPIRNSEGKIYNYLFIQQDITEEKKIKETLQCQNLQIKEALNRLEQAQLQLVQQEKLAGIGQLAAGVAHEINNPLGFVFSNFDMLKKYMKRLLGILNAYRALKGGVEGNLENLQIIERLQQIFEKEKEQKLDFLLEDLEGIIEESGDGLNRIADIVKALRLFARADKNELEEYDLNQGIKNTLVMARNEIKYVAAVQEELQALPLIPAMAGQINQVLLNLIVNAVHAIKEKGIGALGNITVKSYQDGPSVCCVIQDDGIGMTEETINKIFMPFFTTKPTGQGTGLGLSISYDIIVNKHYGEISVTSEKGVGTTFMLKLPLERPADRKNQITEAS
jgi:PAS domain S-box-containing protein